MGKVVLNSLGYDSNLYIFQDKSMFNYSVDTILLGNFVSINSNVKNILEVGTNNGALAIFISERKTDIQIDALEIQEKAILLAQKNVIHNHKEKQINLIHQDFNHYVKTHNQKQLKKYDVIVANPPFYPVNNFKKKLKISKELYYATHEVFLNLEALIKGSAQIIQQKGYLALVVPSERLVDVLFFMRKYDFEPKRIQFIHPRSHQKSNLVLIEGRFKSKPGVHFLPNLYLHNKKCKIHKYRRKIKKLYKPIKYVKK